MNIERISAVMLKVASMANSVRFYRDVLGMEIIYGGEHDGFSSLRTKEEKGPILNLEKGRSVTGWGRLIFYVADVESAGHFLGRTIFHPDGHELSFARPLRPPKI